MKAPKRGGLRRVAATGLLWTVVLACRGGDDLPLNPRPEEDPSVDGVAGGSETGSGGSGGSSPINGGDLGGFGGSGGSGGGGVPPADSDAPDAGAPPDAGPLGDAGTTDAGSGG